ncbi:hypothetical protein N288_23145 [Bacillus infantis NRRL B-14911]|uniref:Dynamin N-terminal domain-containing protein n=2 Tax=Bacillaceae TaxID=186817 RepID=U5LGC0_9BACI|nr:hypothetical protein N288_23145 [Bacillus infantis NRRL B-14911]
MSQKLQLEFQEKEKRFAGSPLRQDNLEIPVIQINSLLDQIIKDAGVLVDKCQTPVKVVLMGEVKAGKSTLLNALAGAEVSPVNIAEATASIIEIYHSPERVGKIIRSNCTEINGSPEEIYDLLQEHHGDLDFFKDVEEIKLGFPLPNLQKLHIVDTPGLATVSKQNAKKTEDYIQQSDVVVWVFSAHHLGQADIEDKVEEVDELGKPIVGIINRIDEVIGDIGKLVDYLDTRLNLYITDVFPLSAKQAFKGITENQPLLLEQSGYKKLFTFLEEEVEQNDSIHEESLKSSMEALLQKEIAIHKHFADAADDLIVNMEKRKNDINHFNSQIKGDMAAELRNWFELEFLADEEQILKSKIQDLKLLSNKQDKKQIEELFKQELSDDKIRRTISEKYKSIDKQFQSKWQSAMDVIQRRMEQDLNEHFNDSNQQLWLSIQSITKEVPTGQEQMKDGMGKGMVIAGAYGTTVAAYTAWLGPYAASVSLGTALGAILPPVLITGAAVGAVVKLLSFSKQKKEFMKSVDEAIKNIKRHIELKIIPEVLKDLESESNKIANHLYNEFCQSLANGYSEEELSNIKSRVKSYLADIQVGSLVKVTI